MTKRGLDNTQSREAVGQTGAVGFSPTPDHAIGKAMARMGQGEARSV